MPNKLLESLRPNIEQAKKLEKLLLIKWTASWSEECQKWCSELGQSPEWQELQKEFVVLEWNRDWSPELDQGLQAFVQDRAGMAGWPLNLFVDPGTQNIVFAAPSLEVPDFLRVSRQLAVAWKVDPTQLQMQAEREVQEFSKKDPLKFILNDFDASKDEWIDEKVLYRFLTPLEQSLDLTTGFVGQGTTYLYPDLYRSLLAYDDLSRFGELALVRLASSPLYDVIGGGFFRSLSWDFELAKQSPSGTFDSKWINHVSTEKLLVDNSEMLGVYIDAFKKTNNPFFSQIAHEILELIMDEFKMPGTSLSFANAIWAPEEYYRIQNKDLLEAVHPKGRQAAQIFFGLNEGRSWPLIATDVAVLTEYLGEEAVDLRLSLSDAKRSLGENRIKKIERLKFSPPTRLSELSVLRSLAHASFSFDTPRLTSICEALIEKYSAEFDASEFSNWSLREKAALLRAYTSLSRLYSAQRESTRAKRMFIEAENLIESLQSPLFLEAKTDSLFLGERIDICDHTGTSGLASLLQGLLDFNALQLMGLRGDKNLPVDIGPALGWALEFARPMGLYASGIYSVAMRYLRDHKEFQA